MLLGFTARRLGRFLKPGTAPANIKAFCSIVREPASTPEATSPYPGAKNVPITTQLGVFGGHGYSDPVPVPIPCFQTMTASGRKLEGVDESLSLDTETAVEIYKAMVKLQTVDVLFYEAQRQGRISFYLTSTGEEATIIGSAAALDTKDTAFLQYREQGVLIWRGFTIRQMADQCFGNRLESGKGRQMPIHYGSVELCVHTIGSTLATQLPHAVGAAFAHKVKGNGCVAVAFFGDGAASEGDFHASMNFASTLSTPVVFICRNNGYAISTPVAEQFQGDGIAGRGPGYGIATIRVDGGDAQAMYCATKKARELALENQAPVLIEALTYRSGHHSTSDDSTRYREESEMNFWQAREPVLRFRNWLLSKQLWDDDREKSLRKLLREEVIGALDEAQLVPKAKASAVLTDVYSAMPWHLLEQKEELLQFLETNPSECPADMAVE